jgi:hypothetical protein
VFLGECFTSPLVQEKNSEIGMTKIYFQNVLDTIYASNKLKIFGFADFQITFHNFSHFQIKKSQKKNETKTL